MCDTFVYLPESIEEPVIFGKNSDREPDEAQGIVHYPNYSTSSKSQRTTYIEVETDAQKLEVYLSKPFQLWGAEMGVNQYGVAIGNEAVFTKLPIEKKNTGLTGMDLLRLALERAITAKEALENIILFLEKYGQNACGGYRDKKFYYHNSFIIADAHSAFVLETAGTFWVYQKIKGFRAISNGLSIEQEFDGIHPDAIAHAHKKGWVKKQQAFSFKKAFSQFLMPRLAACEHRRKMSEHKSGIFRQFDVSAAFSILRTHEQPDNFSPKRAGTKSICMHNNGLFCPHQTTGSMVAVLRKNNLPHTVWFTGSSNPCISLYKPFYFGDTLLNEEQFQQPGAHADVSYWWKWEIRNRKFRNDFIHQWENFHTTQQHLEAEWIKEDALFTSMSDLEKGYQLSRKALAVTV